MIKKIIFIILFVLCSTFVLGNQNWFQEGNADLNLPGGNGFIAYGSNLNNLATNLSYTKCSFGGSMYTPVATDFDGDAIADIVVTTTKKIKIYNIGCSLIAEYNLYTTPRAMPVILNVDADDKQEIVLLLSRELVGLEYDNDTATFNESWIVNYTNITTVVNMDWLACNRFNDNCVTFKANTDDAYYFDIRNLNVTNKTAEYPYSHIGTEGIWKKTYGRTETRTAGNDNWILPFCGRSASDNTVNCVYFNDTGDDTGVVSPEIAGASNAVTDVLYNTAIIAKMGNLYRLFVNLHYNKTLSLHSAYVFDMAGNTLHAESITNQINATSNWMVADFNKDGINDACIVYNDTLTIEQVLNCYDADFLSATYRVNLTGLVNVSTTFVMADYDPSSNFLCLASIEGIICPNSSTTAESIYSSGYVYNPDRRLGHGITFAIGSSGSPMYVYSDDNGLGFIVQNTQITADCGNGICDTFESSFSCPTDCGVLSNQTCVTDSDCPTSYPKCLSGQCVSGYTGITCNFNSDCPYNTSICYAGYCISGVSGGLPPSEAENQQQQDIDDSINSTLGLIFGTSTLFKFIIACFIIISVMVMVAGYTNNHIVILSSGALMMICMTVLGMMPVYVLVLILIFGLGIMIFKNFVSPTAGNGGG